MKKLLPLVICMILSLPLAAQNNFCGIENTSFKVGERITYKVYYNLGMVYVGAGEATFSIALERFKGRPAYHITGEGRTYTAYDWIFKVRDKYETYIDTVNLLPLHFIREVNEGDYHKHEDVVFDRQRNTATSSKGTFKVPACVQDVVSSIFYARNVNFDKYKPGDKIPFSMFLDNEVYNIYIRYIGREEVETRFGTFKAIKFKPLLIKGTIFEGGEKMTVWVSDDKNHVPLRVNSPISVGSIKVDMIGYKNLRYPFTSLISKR